MVVQLRRVTVDVGVFLLAFVLLGPALALANDRPSTTHQFPVDSVGGVISGKSIYVNNSRYTTAFSYADVTWSGLYRVDIRAQVPSDLGADFLVGEYTSSTDKLCGSANNYTARLWFNTWYMDPASDFNEKSCAAHELGHMLGIGDHGTGYTNALMYHHVGSYISPQPHDKDDYYYRWP